MRCYFLWSLIVASTIGTLPSARAADDAAVDARVETLLKQMTLDEKIDYIGGDREMYIRPLPRLKLPEIRMSDGPVGVRTHGPTTAYPATVGLAASWNPELAHRFGVATGRDARAREVHIWLAPGVNLARQPECGRNFEYLGEDPLLAARLACEVIKGVQSQGVSATIKHYAANEQEADRHTVSSKVDERTLRELYFVPFEAAVKEADVHCVMTSYNLVNGVHASEHEWMITKVLRGEWGFRGIVMSDWNSVYSTEGPVKAGLDIEMPFAKFMNRDMIKPLLERGVVTEAMIDAKVRNLLRLCVANGYFDRPKRDATIPLDDPTSNEVAVQVAREAIVVLKNEKLLPLDSAALKQVVVIGPNGHPTVIGGGGSSHTTPIRPPISVVDALMLEFGDRVTVDYRPIVGAAELQAFSFEGYQQPSSDDAGLKAEYFRSLDLSGAPVLTRVERGINFDWGNAAPDPSLTADNFSVRWTGRLRVPETGVYQIIGRSDDGLRAYIDDQPVIEMWRDQGSASQMRELPLEAGRTYRLRVEYYEKAGAAVARFGLMPARPMISGEDEAAIRAADAVIACVGFNHETEHEGGDRSFDLPKGQDEAILAALKLNPRTIVVVNSGAGVNMSRWVDQTPAIVQAWYPGQSGNQALVEILLGKVNPSAKLPTTFPRTTDGAYWMKGYPPAKDGTLEYTEGVFMGYRWYDREKVEPLFPFGHGLSYTTFEVGNLKVQPGVAPAVATVTVDVKNTGQREGAEIVQVYVGNPKASIPRPPRELKAFSKVFLKPGESKTVTMTLDQRSLAHYDVAKAAWIAEPGTYVIEAGTSSRSLPLRAELPFKP